MALVPNSFVLEKRNEDFAAGRGPWRSQRWGLIYGSMLVSMVLVPALLAGGFYLLDRAAFEGFIKELGFTIVLALVGCDLAFLALGGLIMERHRRRDQRLSAGTPIQGKVLTCTGTQSAESGFTVEVRCSFLSPEGRTIEAKRSARRDDLKNGPLPEPGTPVIVQYFDEHLHQVV